MHVYAVRNSRHSGSYFRVRNHVEFIIIIIHCNPATAEFKEISLNGGLISFDLAAPACVRMLQRDSLSLVILLRNLQ